jgi:hypothetical protein
MTAIDPVHAALEEIVRSDREWFAKQPDVKRIVIEQTNGTRIRISRRKVEIKPSDGDGKWIDVSDHFPEAAS